MTIEELAVISQREYASIRNEMATREELTAMESTILRSIERIGLQLSLYDSRWSGEFDRLADCIHDIEGRMSAFHPPDAVPTHPQALDDLHGACKKSLPQ